MKNGTKRIFYIFLTLCVTLAVALFIGWAVGGGEDVPALGASSELSPSSSQSGSAPVSGEVSNQNSENISEVKSENSGEISEPGISEESSEDHSTAPGFPVNFIENGPNRVTAEYVAVYNLTEDKFIYGKNEFEKCYPASLTKLVTAILAEKYIGVSEEIVVGDEIFRIGKGSSVAYLQKGYRMNLETLLDAMLLPSGNDAAYTAAVKIGRNILSDGNASIDSALAKYYETANAYVASIGCEGTHISTPDGYHDSEHYTTAWDYVLISREALKSGLIRKVVKKTVAHDKLLDGRQITYNNVNMLIDRDYVTGLKTGTTSEAGYCIAVSTGYNGVELIIISLRSSTPENRYLDAEKLISAAYGWFD